MRNKITGTGFVLSASLLWGSSFAVRKMGMTDIGPIMQNAARFFVAFCFMLLVLFIRATVLKKPINNEMPVLRQFRYGVIIGTIYGLAAFFQQLGLATVTAGEVGFITSLYTILVPVMLQLFFREKIKWQVWIGIIFSCCGLFFVTNFGMSLENGMGILFLGTIMYALQIILKGRYITDADPFLLVTIQVAMGTIVNLIMAILLKEHYEFHMLLAGAWPILYTGLFSLGVANLCQFLGQKRIEPSITAIACSFESVFGLLFGVILLDEKLTAVKSIGCMMIFAAVLIAQTEFRQHKHENKMQKPEK